MIAVKVCLVFHTMLMHCVLVFVKMIMMSCVVVHLGLYLPNIRPGNELVWGVFYSVLIHKTSGLKLPKLQMQKADARHRE